MKLTHEQVLAVETNLAVQYVLAGPGSGKTTVLVERLKYLLKKGSDPQRICVVTFTRSAAREILSRIPDVKLGHCGTIHSLALKICQEHEAVSTVIDEKQAKRLLAQCMESLRIKIPITKLWRYASNPAKIDDDITRDQKLVIQEYNLIKNAYNVLTYDEVIRQAHDLTMEQFKSYQESMMFDDLLLDEAQDCNKDEWALMDSLAHNLFCIGDPDQSLFGFRGAVPMGNKEDDTLTLNMSFRCAPQICKMANNLISRNYTGGKKRQVSITPNLLRGVEGVVAYNLGKWDADSEALYIKEFWDLNHENGTIAVLARNNATVNDTANRLRKLGLEVKEYRKRKDDEDVQKLKLYVSLCADPNNDVLAKWWLEDKLGKDSADRIQSEAIQNMKTINDYDLKLPKFHSVGEFLEYQKGPVSTNPEVQSLFEGVVQKVGAFASMVELAAALSDADLTTLDEGEGIECMTIHSAKGREWDMVFIVGLEENNLPSNRGNLEEERRILYVGLTRAKHFAALCHCMNRKVNPWDKDEELKQSVFFSECAK